jgi:hypothetical protein
MDVEEESEDFEGYPDDVLWIHREFMDIDDLGHWDKDWKQFRREMRLWWIDHGIYREITQAELDRTTIWSGGRTSKGKPDFRLNGKMYVFDKHPEGYHQCQST